MGVKEWLWTASGEGFCLFHAADTRGRVELETMLGKEFAGVLSSDDFSVYNGGKVAAQQKCLAHLRRHFKRVLGLPGGSNAAVAQVFLSLDLLRKSDRIVKQIEIQLIKNELRKSEEFRAYRVQTFVRCHSRNL